MGKMMEVDSMALQAAMLEMWWKGSHNKSEQQRLGSYAIMEFEADLKDLDIVWAKFIGEKVD